MLDLVLLVVPAEFDEIQRNVLYAAPRNIIRQFLPLLPGRQNYKTFRGYVNYRVIVHNSKVMPQNE